MEGSNAPERVPLRLCATHHKIANDIQDSFIRYIYTRKYSIPIKSQTNIYNAQVTYQLGQASSNSITQPSNKLQASTTAEETSRMVTQLTHSKVEYVSEAFLCQARRMIICQCVTRGGGNAQDTYSQQPNQRGRQHCARR